MTTNYFHRYRRIFKKYLELNLYGKFIGSVFKIYIVIQTELKDRIKILGTICSDEDHSQFILQPDTLYIINIIVTIIVSHKFAI